MEKLTENAAFSTYELQWLAKVLDTRFKLYFNNPCDYTSINEIAPPELDENNGTYAQFVKDNHLKAEERIALIMALAPYLKPELLDVFFTRNVNYDRHFTEFGGTKGKNFNGFIPTGETLLFVIGGEDVAARLQMHFFLLNHSILIKKNVLRILSVENYEPFMSGTLSINSEYLSFFTNGELNKPNYSIDFPAKLVETKSTWDDLVLDDYVREEVEEIRTWVAWNSSDANSSLKTQVKPGYRCLFYGPPGTGKTLTASLLGKATGKDVYKIDLSMIVSKYIGETEKNLSSVFDMAENKNWILFFDEADALFGKRSQATSSNDRHSNQEIAYLLQRIEDFPGLIILATNLKSNMDEAFSRRFQTMIHFAMPSVEQRLRLWQMAFRYIEHDSSNIDFKTIAQRYTLAGGAIVNVVMHCALQIQKGNAITEAVIMNGVKKELYKEGKTI